MAIATDEARQVAAYWNRIAPNFDAIYSGKKSTVGRVLDRWLRRDMYERFNWVMQQAASMRPATVCDVGCGSGRFVCALAQQGAQVTGLDFAPEMLRLSRELVERDRVASRCHFVLSDVLNWQTDQQFDLVIAIGFWDYVADPLPRLQVIRGITKRKFLSAWPRHGTCRMMIRKARLKVAGCPVYFWRLPQIEAYLQRSGFRLESVQIRGQLYFVEASPI
jgi:ubiquinone/menaquinone biosynthesis C-methylase UbiE